MSVVWTRVSLAINARNRMQALLDKEVNAFSIVTLVSRYLSYDYFPLDKHRFKLEHQERISSQLQDCGCNLVGNLYEDSDDSDYSGDSGDCESQDNFRQDKYFKKTSGDGIEVFYSRSVLTNIKKKRGDNIKTSDSKVNELLYQYNALPQKVGVIGSILRPATLWRAIKLRHNCGIAFLANLIISVAISLHLFVKSLLFARYGQNSRNWLRKNCCYIQIMPTEMSKESRRADNLIFCFAALGLMLKLDSVYRLIQETLINCDKYRRPCMASHFLSQVNWLKMPVKSYLALIKKGFADMFTTSDAYTIANITPIQDKNTTTATSDNKIKFVYDEDIAAFDENELESLNSTQYQLDGRLLLYKSICKIDRLFHFNLLAFDDDYAEHVRMDADRRNEFEDFVPYRATFQDLITSLILTMILFFFMILTIVAYAFGLYNVIYFDLEARNWKYMSAGFSIRLIEFTLFSYQVFVTMFNILIPGFSSIVLICRLTRIAKLLNVELELYRQVCRIYLRATIEDETHDIAKAMRQMLTPSLKLMLKTSFDYVDSNNLLASDKVCQLTSTEKQIYWHICKHTSETGDCFQLESSLKSTSLRFLHQSMPQELTETKEDVVNYVNLSLCKAFSGKLSERIYTLLDLVEIARCELEEIKFWSTRCYNIYIFANCAVLSYCISIDSTQSTSLESSHKRQFKMWHLSLASVVFTMIVIFISATFGQKVSKTNTKHCHHHMLKSKN